MKTLIKNGMIVNEGRKLQGHIIIDNDRISDVLPVDETPRGDYDAVIDATGCVVMPGVIDTHVHFREPGLTHKADIFTESCAAALGGVTSYIDMPNTSPQTTTLETLADKQKLGAENSVVNYSFFFGATNDNVNLFAQLNKATTPGIKLFMGSSTGNMLVDREDALIKVFSEAKQLGYPIMAHCEDTDIINQNMASAKQQYGSPVPVTEHANIRSSEACWQSSSKAKELSDKTGARLHIAHISTAEELDLLGGVVTGEATVAHLLFCDNDYARLGTCIKCNPAIKSQVDRDALRKALTDGRIATIGTDHAPHTLAEKEGGADTAVSGMPMVQFSLVSMLGLADEGVVTLERLVELMCHNPATLFNIEERGFIRKGYKADVVIVHPHEPWVVTPDVIVSKCGWSPLEGRTMDWRVADVFCNGKHVVNDGCLDVDNRGEMLEIKN